MKRKLIYGILLLGFGFLNLAVAYHCYINDDPLRRIGINLLFSIIFIWDGIDKLLEYRKVKNNEKLTDQGHDGE